MRCAITIIIVSLISFQFLFVRGQDDIVETAIKNGNFKTLVQALTAAGLVDTLKGPGPFTVFAPNDVAFSKLPAGTVDDLLKPENKEKLTDILKYHVIGKRVAAADIKSMTLPAQVETLSNLKSIVDLNGELVKVNSATVIVVDVSTSNGLIHIVDSVILPPTNIAQTAIDNNNFKTLITALTAAGLVDTLKGPGPFTVFAPNDAAFAKLPAGVVDELVKPENKETLSRILQYHVTGSLITSASIDRMALPANITMLAGGAIRVTKNGGTVKINDASVTTADVFNSNGLIHIIDSVILPPLDIVETVITNGNFKTLVTALKAADLVSVLKGVGPFTVFAPNDVAFGKLPTGTLDDLLKPENKEKLANILKYHVVNGKRIVSTDLTPPQSLEMFAGGNAEISKVGDKMQINQATIITVNVGTNNGIIHIIDNVLTPSGNSATSLCSSKTFVIMFVSTIFFSYRFAF